MARPIGNTASGTTKICPRCQERERDPDKTYCYICLPLYHAARRAAKKAEREAANGPQQPST